MAASDVNWIDENPGDERPACAKATTRVHKLSLNLPDLLSLLRVPLGVAFVPLAGSPIPAVRKSQAGA